MCYRQGCQKAGTKKAADKAHKNKATAKKGKAKKPTGACLTIEISASKECGEIDDLRLGDSDL